MDFDVSKLVWTRAPQHFVISPERIEIETVPHTDLWQRTYYHFRNDNAPVLQMTTDSQYFSFVVKTDFAASHHRFDQCGIVLYLDSENWLKGSIEYENERFAHLGSVVTNQGYSDWFSHRVLGGRRNLQANARVPPACGARPGIFWRLCLQPGRFLVYGGLHQHGFVALRLAGP